MRPSRRAAAGCLLLALSGCGGAPADGGADSSAPEAAATTTVAPSASAATAGVADQRHPDIVDVEITPAGDGMYDLAVTVSSPYDTPQRYADGWRVLGPDGTVLGTHMLAHDHAGEQPFTRTQAGLVIPPDVTEVTVEGRDQRYGYGGGTHTVPVPHDQG